MTENSRHQVGQGVRPVSDDEISDWQGLPGDGPINSEKERRQRAQSRKRQRVRKHDQSDEVSETFAAFLVIGGIIAMFVVALFAELGQ